MRLPSQVTFIPPCALDKVILSPEEIVIGPVLLNPLKDSVFVIPVPFVNRISLFVAVFPAVKTCWRVGVGWIAPVAPWAPVAPCGPVTPVIHREHRVLQHDLLPKYEL